ncbi:SPOR domain-containing protein [Microvirga arsenatis]|uniref:D-alanyl-D-alanine carboxypeptidase n=1 Tax=Microvirga arsenatis TaxID=2692265 RepID=A0ABW9YXE7_9HYPH|nr:SPOR domain-containing protein [Microvirga arsenatis]NBJ10111.1 D-alanyl-D-alanine carboxypeptidase [Microvirga arsenatis]NBJ23179.1 D-alanyl-D-alanine carboxypeptidase [Microvirga arsenatis]
MNSVWTGHRKTWALLGIVASFAVAVVTPAEAARRKAPARGGYSPPTASIVVDAKTGKILQGENIDEPRIPASITKVMSLYLLFEQLERGRMSLSTPLTVSAYAASQPPTKLGLRPGSTIEVDDAIKAMVTLSANDVSVVVAENIAGSEEAFAQMMTRKARELGMSSTAFYNPHGLPHDPPNITTARDLSILGRAIQDRFPKYFAYFQTRSFQYGSRTIRGHNRLLGKVEGVDGIKTGYTRLSGFNLLTSVNTDTRSIVAVVLGGRSGASRDQKMASLIDNHLPRAYAGARIAPPVVENSAQPAMVAEAPAPRPVQPAPAPAPVRVASATPEAPVAPAAVAQTATPQAAPERKPLDLNSLRPVVASAAGASSTTTPSSTSSVRWQKGPEALPTSAQAYAALPPQAAPAQIPASQKAALQAKIEAKAVEPAPAATTSAVTKTASLKVEAPKAEPVETKKTVSGWVIQLGATDDESKAKAMLDSARSRFGKVLGKASPFTEKVTVDGSTLYRARFSGFSESDDAAKVCKQLKKSGVSCFASRG